MSGVLRVIATVVAIYLLESTVLYRLGPVFRSIDLLLLYVAWLAMRKGAVDGILIGLGIGLFRSIVWSGPVGAEVVAFGVAAWFAGEAHRHLVGESVVGLLLIVSGTVIVHDLVLLFTQIPDGLLSVIARFVLVSVPSGIVTALVGVFLFEVRRRLSRPPRKAVG